jgi:glycine/D-amino acid oxidase-like deaminating enzyme
VRDPLARKRRRLTRRAFLKGAVVGGAGMWAAAVLPRRLLSHDPDRPPALYEFFVDSFWMDAAGMSDVPVLPPLRGRHRADVAIVGGGFAGMATAYHLARRLPGKRVLLLEGARCGYGASGRNGGFADPGMPGLGWVYERAGPEAARRYYDATSLGLEQIRAFRDEHGVDCDLEENGSLELATEPAHLDALAARKARLDRMGLPAELLDGPALRRAVRSERFVGALRVPGSAILNPAKLALGMRRVIESLGVEISERSKVMRIEPGSTVRLVTEYAEVEAPRVVVTVNGYGPALGLFTDRLLPLCNYVCATEPLSPAQRESLGWAGREGLADERVQFMYLRLTRDERIVFGGESAPYFYGGSPSTGVYRPSVERLERSLLATFPQLEGVRFTHTWGGTMGFTLDFVPSIGRLDGADNVFYACGFNGEGVVMTQLAGRILAHLVAGDRNELTGLPIVGKRMPWLGPEPLRSIGVRLYERFVEWEGDNPVR